MNRPYQLVVFDFDGTLADSFDWFLDIFDVVAERFNLLPFDQSDLDALRNMGPREIMARQRVPAWKLPLIAKHVRRLQAGHMHKIQLFEGIEDVLRTLKASGIRVAVVSSNARSNIEAALGAELTALIDHFACGAGVFGKAHKFRALCRKLGVPPGAVLSVGDEVRDIDSARQVGLKTGAVSWGFATPGRLKQESPDHFFSHPREILSAAGLVPAA